MTYSHNTDIREVTARLTTNKVLCTLLLYINSRMNACALMHKLLGEQFHFELFKFACT